MNIDKEIVYIKSLKEKAATTPNPLIVTDEQLEIIKTSDVLILNDLVFIKREKAKEIALKHYEKGFEDGKEANKKGENK